MIVAAVLAAGAAGALTRFGASKLVRAPWGVLVVNVAGSAIAGAVTAIATDDIRLIVVTGFCGGLTTFSTFTVETVQLVLDGRSRAALLSVALNLVLGVAAAATAFAVVTG